MPTGASPTSPDAQRQRRRQAGLWLGFGLLQGLMAAIIGAYVLAHGRTGAGLAAIGAALLVVLWSGLRVRSLTRPG